MFTREKGETYSLLTQLIDKFLKEANNMRGDSSSRKGFSRRKFIKTTAVGVGSTVLASLDTRSAGAAGLPRKWDKEADVIVVGCGGAGTTAAITAHDRGAKVIIIEKAPEGGGNTRVGGAQFSYSTPEKKDNAAKYLHYACNGTTPMDVCQAWADEMVHNREWLDKMGIVNTPFMRNTSDGSLSGGDYRQFPGADGIGTAIMTGWGMAWYNAIEKQMKDRGIEIMFNSPAKELVQDCTTKEILGVKIDSEGKDMFVKARKGVILCTGGFEFNEEMKKNYLRPTTIKFTGWKYNTGDGIKMAQAVGADLWHMNLICSARAAIETSPMPMAWMYPSTSANGFIWVNKYGERFVAERLRGGWDDHKSFMGMVMWDWRRDRKDPEYPLAPHYLIFDETTRKAGAIAGWEGMANVITPKRLGGNASEWGAKDGGWSQDNSAEIEKGWIMKADTVRGLADVIAGPELPAEKLESTVNRWNEFCEAGVDKDFGRPANEMVKIATPPFYAVRYWPGGFSTHGGPKRNAKGQVLGVDEKPIGRLYSAGSLGHTHGQVYNMSGANYCECFVWGRISGRNAAALKPWA
jgi:succinate dehydrogenase/fumarate reductase flavoprotein subunit